MTIKPRSKEAAGRTPARTRTRPRGGVLCPDPLGSSLGSVLQCPACACARHLMSEQPIIKLPVVLPHPTNTQLKRTRQGFCWGCGASLKEAHSHACEFDGKRLRRDAPARVAIVVRAAAGRGCPPAVVTLHVFSPHTDTLQQLTSGTE